MRKPWAWSRLHSPSSPADSARSGYPSIGSPVAAEEEESAPAPSLDYLTGLMQWVKSDTGTYTDTGLTTPATSDTANVKGWEDQSGNSRHFTEGTNNPILKLSQVNGKPSVRFDGTNDKINALFTLNLPYTIFAVVKQITWASNAVIVGGGAGDNFSFSQHTSSPNIRVPWLGSGAGGSNDGNLAVGAWGIVEVNIGVVTKYIQVNNNTSTTQVVTNAGTKGGITLAAHPNPSNFANVEFAEFLLYDHAVSGANATIVRDYLNSRYAIF